LPADTHWRIVSGGRIVTTDVINNLKEADMKLTYTNGKIAIVAESPDDRIQKHFAERFCEAINREVDEFLQECQVALRKLKPGQEVTLTSRPIVVTMSAEKETAKR
jgi:RNA 3'-terminal phosphate cyclase